MLYQTKSVTIEAVEFTEKNLDELWRFVGNDKDHIRLSKIGKYLTLKIKTLEGEMTAKPGDFIIKGLVGEFYACKPNAFKLKYEPVLVAGINTKINDTNA